MKKEDGKEYQNLSIDELDESISYDDQGLNNILSQAIPNSSISKINVEPPGMPGCENLP